MSASSEQEAKQQFLENLVALHRKQKYKIMRDPEQRTDRRGRNAPRWIAPHTSIIPTPRDDSINSLY